MLKDVFQVYLNRLIDLSGRNRSIFLPKLITSQMIDLKELHFLNNHPSFFYITELLGRKKNIPLIQTADPRDKHINELSQKIRRLQQHIRLVEEESGERNVFVGWPFVEGKLPNEQLIRCPLIFFPVTLAKNENSWYMSKTAGDQPFLNKAFLLAYAHAQGKELDQEWLDKPLESFSRDPREFRTQLYHYLNEGLTLNFNQELLEDKLDFFSDIEKGHFQQEQKTGLLKLKPYAVLGQFSQKTSFLIDDYNLLKESPQEDLETFLSEKFAVDESPLNSRDQTLFNTFPIDASQEEVMKAVRAGESCVVQGPPGTGKSQLICNLVADFTSRGKKVLVVSQKRAALDVVFKRLSEQGFAPFTALVHDFRFDRKALFWKLSHQINSLDTYQELNRSLDTIQLERTFNQLGATIEQYSDYLEEYKQALFDRNECGVPIKELYVTSSLQDEHLDLRQYYKKYRLDELDAFFRNFRDFVGYYKRYQDPSSFWLHRNDFSVFGPSALVRLKEILGEIREMKEKANLVLEKFRISSPIFSSVFKACERKQQLLDIRQFVEEERNFRQLKKLLVYEAEEFDLLWLENKIDSVKKLIASEGVEWSVEDEDVERHLALSVRALQLRDSWWQSAGLWWSRNKYQEVWELLKKNGLRDDKQGLKRLIAKLENRLNLNHQYTLLDRKSWISLPEKPFTFPIFNHFAINLQAAIRHTLTLADLEMMSPYLVGERASHAEFKSLLDELIALSEEFGSNMEAWGHYLSQIQLKHLLHSPDDDKLDQIQGTLSQDFVELVELDKLKKKIRSVDLELMSKMIHEYPDKDFAALKPIFLSGLKLGWIEHIEAKYPVLQEVGTQKSKRVLEELAAAVEEKLKISRFIAELRFRERTFNQLEYNRLNNLVTYRELGHQVTKKKRIWPIKKLIENFETEIFRLMPCWLVSPETASALFPLVPLFDLVVFDESSQCFVERGLPALLRGKQMVVAGDSQQLQPYDLYQVRIESEEEGIATETESLLELISRYFKTYTLENHYRSQSLPLIEFSSRHFYNHTLSMLPDREVLNKGTTSFELIKVDGVWEKQTNKEEADQVVRQLQLLNASRSPLPDIGVVTFNYYQMELILDLIAEDETLSKATNVQVKNIENVQGDEFDIVLFSIGYARNRQGKFTANFGLLARSGGENRLNVAITRAREKIILVTSLSLRDFSEGLLQNGGIRLLRDYLRYVEDTCAGKEVTITAEKPTGFEVSWYLKNQLMGNYGNHEVRNNSLSKAMDLELLEDGRYVAGILTDDHRLYASRSVKEAFVYHPRLLRQKKWEAVHIFSRQYWLDREDLLETKLVGKEEN
jgi:hypothetical protein